MSRPPTRSPRPSVEGFRRTTPVELFWNFLTFDRLMTGPVIHMVYWAGLALVVLGGFSIVGGAVGVALREPDIWKWVLAVPVAVAGFLVLFIVALVWRSICELYVAIFRISDDMRAMRALMEQAQKQTPPEARPPAASQDDLVSKI